MKVSPGGFLLPLLPRTLAKALPRGAVGAMADVGALQERREMGTATSQQNPLVASPVCRRPHIAVSRHQHPDIQWYHH